MNIIELPNYPKWHFDVSVYPQIFPLLEYALNVFNDMVSLNGIENFDDE